MNRISSLSFIWNLLKLFNKNFNINYKFQFAVIQTEKDSYRHWHKYKDIIFFHNCSFNFINWNKLLAINFICDFNFFVFE